jgi:UbiD family decarboxylase
MCKDFRGHLEFLEENGKLLKVRKEVDIRFDIAAGTRKISDTDGPALLFENVMGFPEWRVASGVFATQKLVALALGLPADTSEQTIINRYLECDQKRIKPRLVTKGPVKEVIIKGDEVDLTKLPIPIYSELDAGPYLTAGVEVSKHPRTGIQNVSIHRRLILDKNRTTILAFPPQHLGQMIEAAEKEGYGLPIATVIGVEPAVALASCVRAPEGVDETEIAGAIQGAPVEVVNCETIDVTVPAHAEIVIEGVVLPNERALCGPFGEFPGNYITMTGSLQREAPVIKVTAITMRKKPIFQGMLTGVPVTENHTLKKWSNAASTYRFISEFANVRALNFTPGGACHYHLVVAINKKDDQEPKRIIDSLLHARYTPSLVIVVDDDINVYDPVEVEWALATRMNPAKDITITSVDISQQDARSISRWGIDATVSGKEKQYYKKIKVPGIEKVDYV